MKRFAFMAVAIVAVLATAMPAFALNLTATGNIRSRGFMDSNISLSDEGAQSDTWMDMRLRVNPTLTVSDNLTIHARFDAIDDVTWGQDLGTSTNHTNWDRLWMAIKTDYGKLEIGRMTGKTFGTLFMDTASSADRIKYSYALNELVLGAVYEKAVETDSLYTTSDSDYNKYFLFGNYASEMITGGLLMGWYQNKGASDFYDGNTHTSGWSCVNAPLANANPYDSEFWFFNPYAIVKIDDITVQGEIFYNIGKAMEFDQKEYSDLNNGLKDIDLDAWAWNLEAQYNMGPFNFQAGYAWLGGQGDDHGKQTEKITTLGTIGEDWQKLWILTNNEDENLYGPGEGSSCGLGGGWGNLSATNGLAVNGAKIFYLGAGFKPVENLSLNIIYGNAKAEAPLDDKWSDNYGSEYDFNLVWNIMDNLTYTFIAAYLDAGDFFKDSAGIEKLDNDYSLFHQIELSF